jgi:Family of unknown function (DUF5681)
MTDNDVGYKSPPKSRRFRPGVSGNPKGPPKRKPPALAETIEKVLNAKIEYREGGRTRFATARELSLRMLVDRAAKGDVAAAEHVLKVLERAERNGDVDVTRIEIRDWLPDFPGQSGAQKAEKFAASRDSRGANDSAVGTAEE